MIVKELIYHESYKISYRTGHRLNKTRILIRPYIIDVNIAYIDIDIVGNIKIVNYKKINQ